MSKDNWWEGIPANRHKRDTSEVVSDCRRKVPLPPKEKAIVEEGQLPLPMDVEHLKPELCPICYGRGTFTRRVCYACKGRGIVPASGKAEVGTDDVSGEV